MKFDYKAYRELPYYEIYAEIRNANSTLYSHSWNYLTALRGPDAEPDNIPSSRAKRLFTCFLRGYCRFAQDISDFEDLVLGNKNPVKVEIRNHHYYVHVHDGLTAVTHILKDDAFTIANILQTGEWQEKEKWQAMQKIIRSAVEQSNLKGWEHD